MKNKTRFLHPEWNSWMNMRARCLNNKHPAYKNYGARGITVCERWGSFKTFLEDMGKKPSPKHTLERNDNNLGYNPGNCSWSTRIRQARNQRTNRIVTIDGRSHCVSEWAEILGVKATSIFARIYRLGWSEEKAVTTPFINEKYNKFPRILITASTTEGPIRGNVLARHDGPTPLSGSAPQEHTQSKGPRDVPHDGANRNG